MPNFFHVTPNPLTPGQILQPGRFGQAQIQISVPGQQWTPQQLMVMLWEIVLETARVAVAPSATSRLSCIFATREMAHAIAFRDRWRKGDQIYEVSCAEETPTHDGNYDAITDPPRGGVPLLNFMPKYAVSYWRDKPAGIAEVLIGGPVTVVRRVE